MHEVGLEKCVKATFLKVYKYLGVNERNGIQHATMKEKSIKECYRRVRAFTKKELNSAN